MRVRRSISTRMSPRRSRTSFETAAVLSSDSISPRITVSGRAQLMGGIAREAGGDAERLVQPPNHAIERFGNALKLVTSFAARATARLGFCT